MEEIKVGEYVRTKNKGICKIDHINEKAPVNKYWVNPDYDGWCTCVKTTQIVKHSFNIIDLIEPGDLVRIFVEENIDADGITEDTCVYEVSATQITDFNGNKLDEIGIVGESGPEIIPFEIVRGIVTREQFKSIEYEV